MAEKLSPAAQEMCQGCAYNSGGECEMGFSIGDRNQLAESGLCQNAGVGCDVRGKFHIIPSAFVKVGDHWTVVPTKD